MAVGSADPHLDTGASYMAAGAAVFGLYGACSGSGLVFDRGKPGLSGLAVLSLPDH